MYTHVHIYVMYVYFQKSFKQVSTTHLHDFFFLISLNQNQNSIQPFQCQHTLRVYNLTPCAVCGFHSIYTPQLYIKFWALTQTQTKGIREDEECG